MSLDVLKDEKSSSPRFKIINLKFFNNSSILYHFSKLDSFSLPKAKNISLSWYFFFKYVNESYVLKVGLLISTRSIFTLLFLFSKIFSIFISLLKSRYILFENVFFDHK